MAIQTETRSPEELRKAAFFCELNGALQTAAELRELAAILENWEASPYA